MLNPGLINANIDKTGATINPATSDNQTDGSQKTQIVDSSGNVIGSESHGNDYYLLTDHKDITTSGTLSALNATVELTVHGTGSALMDIGGTWTGKIIFEGAMDGNWVNLSLVQPLGGITRNGVQNDNQNGVYRVLIITAYTKIRARMSEYTSGTATILLNASSPVGTSYVWQLNQANLLSTVYQPTGTNLHTVIDSGTIAALTNGTQKSQISDLYGFMAENTPMGELRVANPVRLVGATFPNGGNAGAVDSNFWTATATNNATIVQANNQVTLSSSTTNNGSGILQSVRRARYVGGNSNRFRAQIQLGDIGVASNTRRWGIFDGTDGAYFELAGTTLSACVMKTGNRTSVAVLSAPTTNITSYEIYITNSKVYFVISDVLVATHSASTATWADNFNLPVRIDNINSGSVTNSTISVRVATIYRLGDLSTNPQYFHGTTAATTVLKYGAGLLHKITLNNPSGTLITIYDDTTGTSNVIAVINTPAIANPVTLHYDLPFSNGLKIISTGTWDYTVIYE